MSAIVPGNGSKGRPAVLIDDASIFNLETVQLLIGFKNEYRTKEWVKTIGIPYEPKNTWLFTGRLFRKALERHLERPRTDDASAEGED